MRPTPPPAARSDPQAVDLLVVGALSIDRFGDGSIAAGGSAVHATRAGVAMGARVAVVTVAGLEPEAQSILADLARIALVRAERSRGTLSYTLDLGSDGRRLTLAEQAPLLAAPPTSLRPRAVLYAPVAGEFGADLAGQRYPGAVSVAILQGWLRSLDRGRPVQALPLTSLAEALVAELRSFDALVACSEDLVAESSTPAEQLARLRDRFGDAPLLVVTDGERGAWYSTGAGVNLVTPASVLHGPALGAGDAFGAALSLALADGLHERAAVEWATTGAVGVLGKAPH